MPVVGPDIGNICDGGVDGMGGTVCDGGVDGMGGNDCDGGCSGTVCGAGPGVGIPDGGIPKGGDIPGSISNPGIGIEGGSGKAGKEGVSGESCKLAGGICETIGFWADSTAIASSPNSADILSEVRLRSSG